MPSWNPDLYLKFSEQRTRPARDLASRAAAHFAGRKGPERAADIGCGPGNSTATVAETFPGAALTGVDSSPEMIAKARESALSADWTVADAAEWEPPSKFGLVFSNAALQWIPDQASLIAKMAGWLESGGVLAVQVPGNGGSPLHLALREAAEGFAGAERFAGLDDAIRYREPGYFHEALEAAGLEGDIWETTYWHRLPNRASLIEWYSGTGMRPYLDRLRDGEERERFKDRVLEIAEGGYPELADGTVFFPFRRIFFTGVKRP